MISYEQIATVQRAIQQTELEMQHNLSKRLYGDAWNSSPRPKPNIFQATFTKIRVSVGNSIGNLADKVRGYSLDDY